MTDAPHPLRFRFGVFELDPASGELRRKGLRVKLHAQPFQVLVLLLARPGEMLTREEISRELWPEGTFVDFDHGVNSAVNRLRDALGDTARSPRFVETIARRGYRFVAPVERVESGAAPVPAVPVQAEPARMPEVAEPSPEPESIVPVVALPEPAVEPVEQPPMPSGLFDRVLATEDDLPRSSPAVVQTLFLLLQGMYLAFYVGALANLPEIAELLGVLEHAAQLTTVITVTAALLIPVRVFLLTAVLFRAPGFRGRFLRLWPYLLPFDLLWALSPFLLLHHIPYGLALGATAPLVYAPFAQRSLVLMGAGKQA